MMGFPIEEEHAFANPEKGIGRATYKEIVKKMKEKAQIAKMDMMEDEVRSSMMI